MAFQSDPLLDHRFAATALGSAAPGFSAAKANLQEGLITDRAATTLLSAVGERPLAAQAESYSILLGLDRTLTIGLAP
jgi:hypothetical protein